MSCELRFMLMGRLATSLVFVSLVACGDEPDAPSAGERAKSASSSRAQEPAPPADVEEQKPVVAPKAEATSGAPGASKDSAGGGRERRGGVKLATVTGLQGSLTQQQVEQTIAGSKSQLLACYGNTEARVEVSMQIVASGEVGEVAVRRSTPDQPKQRECAAVILGKVRFPPPNASLKLDLAIVLEPEQ